MDYNLKELLDVLPVTAPKKSTYLEEMRAAQRETIMANLLAFYFKPQKPHGLGNLFLRALLDTDCLQLFENKGAQKLALPAGLTVLRVKPEVETKPFNIGGPKGRMDILIETETAVIAIEFKINHVLNNPLDAYIKHINDNYAGKDAHYLVLSPVWKKPEFEFCSLKAQFRQVMLGKFIAKVEELVEQEHPEFLNRNDTHTHHYRDFINTIKNRSLFSKMMEAYIALANEQGGEDFNKKIEDVFSNLLAIQKEIEAKVESLKIMLNQSGTCSFNLVRSSKNKLSSAIEAKSGAAKLKVRLTLKGWTIEEWQPGSKARVIQELEFGIKTTELAEAVLGHYSGKSEHQTPEPEHIIEPFAEVPRIYPRLSEEQRTSVLREFKRIQEEEEKERQIKQ